MISIKTTGLRRARKQMQAYGRAVKVAEFRTVNRVANKTRTAAGREIRKQVNLKAKYVNQHLRVSKRATLADPSAIITARQRPTRLARYGANQLTRKSAVAKGDPTRRIAAGRKAAGVSVKVSRRRRRSRLRGAFLMPLKNSGVMGVFVRTGPGRGSVKHLYGPSVDQVFRDVRTDLEPTIAKSLREEFIAQWKHASRHL